MPKSPDLESDADDAALDPDDPANAAPEASGSPDMAPEDESEADDEGDEDGDLDPDEPAPAPGRINEGTGKLRRQQNKRWTREYADAAGPVPEDPLEFGPWMQRLLMVAAQTVVADKRMTEAVRRRELRQLAKAIHQLTPASRLLAAEKAIRQAADDQESTRLGAKPTPVEKTPDGAEKPPRPLRLPRAGG